MSNFPAFYEHKQERPNLKSEAQVVNEKEFELKGSEIYKSNTLLD